MKSRKKLLFAFFLLPLLANAQDNFQPGIVVNLKGDTMRGFINYKQWENNPRSIAFQSANGVAPIKLTVRDIKYFGVSVGNLVEYQRYEGLITLDNTDVNRLSTSRDTSTRPDTVFLRIVQRGKNLTLFSYSDNIKERFYMAEKPADQPVELGYRLYYNATGVSARDRGVYENTYQKQFFQLALKTNTLTESLQTDIEKSDYKERDIIYITSKINGISPTDTSKTNRGKRGFFVKALAVLAAIGVTIEIISEFSHSGQP